jgi:glutamate-1-semialdehyde 2,1-aminomutase
MRVLPYQLPLVAERGLGPRIWDADGNEYIDMNMGYGPLLFGHRHPKITEAVIRQLQQHGSHLGFPTEVTMRVAEKLKCLYPTMELLRFANSGTEAIASSVRLARVTTGRKKIILFEGHYHGWSEAVFHRYHAPLEMLPDQGFGPALPGTEGMNCALQEVLVVRWNDIEALRRCMEYHGSEVAACLMEPVMGNAGCIPPKIGYLKSVREEMHKHGALLIFDEVITGLRVAAGGAQERYEVRPDITVISKALGGGFPVAAFGSSEDIMSVIVNQRLFHGGVYSGNAMVMAACEAVLDEIAANGVSIYQYLEGIGDEFACGIRDIFRRFCIPCVVQNVGSIVSFIFTTEPVESITEYRVARRLADPERHISFQHSLQKAGVFFHPNLLEPMFLSLTHTRDDINQVLQRMEQGASECFK